MSLTALGTVRSSRFSHTSRLSGRWAWRDRRRGCLPAQCANNDRAMERKVVKADMARSSCVLLGGAVFALQVRQQLLKIFAPAQGVEVGVFLHLGSVLPALGKGVAEEHHDP